MKTTVRPGAHCDADNAANAGQIKAGFCDPRVWICQRELRGRAGQHSSTSAFAWVTQCSGQSFCDADNAGHAGQSSAGFCDSRVWICQRKLRGRAGQHSSTSAFACAIAHFARLQETTSNVRSHCVTQCFPYCVSLPCSTLRPPASQYAPGLSSIHFRAAMIIRCSVSCTLQVTFSRLHIIFIAFRPVINAIIITTLSDNITAPIHSASSALLR
jgi:hypothetical protein